MEWNGKDSVSHFSVKFNKSHLVHVPVYIMYFCHDAQSRFP